VGREPLARWSLGELLDEVAAQTPTPGGGTSAAFACALAASLVEMAARFTLARDEYVESHARMVEVQALASKLCDRAAALAEEELYAYEPVLEALRLPRDDPDWAVRVQTARLEASAPPLELAGIAAELAELAAEIVRAGNENLAGDAITGALLAEAGAQAAARLVAINLEGAPADERVAEARRLAERALAARDQALR
jgi:formiminotetrahydrofolate cyclodeaminase